MVSLKEIIKQADEGIFKIVGQVQSSSAYREIIDKISGLSTTQQKVINHTASILSMLLPVLIVLTLLIQNISMKNNINSKEEIKSAINILFNDKQSLAVIGKNITSSSDIKDESSLKLAITPYLKSKNVSSSDITISNFSEGEQADTISKTSATISFKKFTTSDFTAFLEGITTMLKATVTAIVIKRDEKSSLIEGNISIVHFKKNN